MHLDSDCALSAAQKQREEEKRRKEREAAEIYRKQELQLSRDLKTTKRQAPLGPNKANQVTPAEGSEERTNTNAVFLH